MKAQPAILESVPGVGRYLFFSLIGGTPADAAQLKEALQRLVPLADGKEVVAGIGPLLAGALDATVPGLREFPAMVGRGAEVPSTPAALWCWLRGSDRGDMVWLTRKVERALKPALHLDHVVDAFLHKLGENGFGRDLTGYEDGTENPKGEAAAEAAILQASTPGMEGSSFVAVQQWVHDLDAFEGLSEALRDHAVGRRLTDNEELEDAAQTAHVKRAEQESFAPPAFVLRKSMPWAQDAKAGLMFVAFGRSFDAFEAQMRRMAGLEDGIVDAMFTLSQPVSGAYFWCPPMENGRLDLRQLGI